MGAGGWGGGPQGVPRCHPRGRRGRGRGPPWVPTASPGSGCGVWGVGVLWSLMRLVSMGRVWGCMLLGKASGVCVPPPTMALCPRHVTPCTPMPSPGWVGGWVVVAPTAGQGSGPKAALWARWCRAWPWWQWGDTCWWGCACPPPAPRRGPCPPPESPQAGAFLA